MTAAAPLRSFDGSKKVAARDQIGARCMEKSFRKSRNRRRLSEDAGLAWFARQLWGAFPEAASENELADLVAEVLTTDDRPVHPRTVRNWLRGDNAPHFRYTLAVLVMVGGEAVMDLIDGDLS